MRFPDPHRLPVRPPDATGDNDKAVERQLFDKLVKKALTYVNNFENMFSNEFFNSERWSGFIEHPSGRKNT